MDSFYKTKNDDDYTGIVISVYKLLSNKYGYTMRISDIFQLIKDSFGLSEFEILEYNNINNAELESFLIEKQIEWQKGNKVDFVEIYNKIIYFGDFTKNEKDLFLSGKIEERLWAIFLSVTDPFREDILNN